MSEGVLRESTLEVSADLVRNCPGLSIDVGGSVAKVIYRTKAEYDRLLKDKDAKTGTLRLLSCVRTELFKAVARVHEDGYITQNQDGSRTEIFTCGIGCSQFSARINRDFNVKLNNVIEMDCFVKAFIYLVSTHSFPELMHAPYEDIVKECITAAEERIQKFTEFKKHTIMELPDVKPLTKQDRKDYMSSKVSIKEEMGDTMYPCLLAMLGSGFGFMLVQKDDSFSLVDGSAFGGRHLLGMGALLVGTNSYDELIDLAEKGNHFAVNASNRSFDREHLSDEDGSADNDEDNVYGKFKDMPETLAFAYGHGVGKKLEDFRREDLAAAVVYNSVIGVVAQLVTFAIEKKAPCVMVCGSFANRKYMRDIFAGEWYKKIVGAMLMHDVGLIDVHFMKQGSHLGALGAMINNTEGFFSKDGTVVEQSTETPAATTAEN